MVSEQLDRIEERLERIERLLILMFEAPDEDEDAMETTLDGPATSPTMVQSLDG